MLGCSLLAVALPGGSCSAFVIPTLLIQVRGEGWPRTFCLWLQPPLLGSGMASLWLGHALWLDDVKDNWLMMEVPQLLIWRCCVGSPTYFNSFRAPLVAMQQFASFLAAGVGERITSGLKVFASAELPPGPLARMPCSGRPLIEIGGHSHERRTTRAQKRNVELVVR